MITEGLAVSLWRPAWELSDGQRRRLMSPPPNNQDTVLPQLLQLSHF